MLRGRWNFQERELLTRFAYLTTDGILSARCLVRKAVIEMYAGMPCECLHAAVLGCFCIVVRMTEAFCTLRTERICDCCTAGSGLQEVLRSNDDDAREDITARGKFARALTKYVNVSPFQAASLYERAVNTEETAERHVLLAEALVLAERRNQALWHYERAANLYDDRQYKVGRPLARSKGWRVM